MIRGQRTRWPAGLLAQAERSPCTSILSIFSSTPLAYYYSLVGKKVLNLGIRDFYIYSWYSWMLSYTSSGNSSSL